MHPSKISKIFREFKPQPFLSKIYIKHSSCGGPVTSGLVLGVYDCPEGGGKQVLTDAGERLNDSTNGLIYELLKKQYIQKGKAVLYSHVVPGFSHVALASLGPKNPNRLNFIEQLNEEKENIRLAMAAGARLVQDEGANKISVDGATVPESAAEGSILATYKYKANITSGDRSNPSIELYDHKDVNSWASGEINAEAQNWARFLSHAPPNFKRPLMYVNEVMDKLCKFDIRIDARNKDWMMNRKMYATLGMIKNSSCEPPVLLELGYCGDEPKAKPVCFVGKGNIFDSGGLFMKSYKGIHEFRADMGGAAAICATIMAAARKRLPINIRGVIILYEMMPAPMSLKPGDVLKDKDGTYIRISDPDNDCRVAFSDLVNFSEYYSPSIVVGVGTFTKAVAHALGLAASGLFSPQTSLWHEFQRAGLESGDRLWRMPLWQYFNKLNRSNRSIDLDNGTSPTGGDACQAAAFVNEFVPKEVDCCCPKPTQYVHLDCFNTALLSQTEEEIEPYYREGIKMGRPTRALIQFLYHRACFLNTQKSKSQKK